MSRVDELIQNLCPKGIDFNSLSDCASIKRGKRVTKNELNSNETYPVYSGGVTPMGYYSKYNQPSNTITIVKYGTAGFVNFIKEDFWANDVCYCVKPKDFLDNKFLFYVLKAKQTYIQSQVTDAIPAHLPTEVIGNIAIPIPPLEVQKEIVNILDKFTQLEAELSAELSAELEARKEQYEYYKQLCFNNITSSRIEHITHIASVKARVGWQRLTKSEHLPTGDYQLITGTDFSLGGDVNFLSCVFVTKDRYDMDTNIQVHKDDILITKDGTLGKVALVRDEPTKPTTLNSGVFRISLNTDDILPSYIYHFFTSKYFSNFVESVKTGSTIPHLTQQGLTTLNIPIPSLNEQKRIVVILDNFNKLINSISEGLPAEIKARRKQYEYYRTKLLTFKELK